MQGFPETCTYPTNWTVPDVVTAVPTAITGIVFWKGRAKLRVHPAETTNTQLNVKSNFVLIFIHWIKD